MNKLDELEEKVDRIAELVALTWKLAKAVMRGHNKTTKVFNENFDVFEDNVNRNAQNIDKMVNTLQELMGEEGIIVKKSKEQKIGQDSKMMFL